MLLDPSFQQATQSEGDVLLAYRDRVAMQLSTMAVLTLSPFTLINLYAGNLGLTLAIALTQAALVVNVRALKHGRRVVVPFEVLSLVIVSAVVFAGFVLGLRGVFWAYPGLFILHFIVARTLARALSLLLAVVCPALLVYHGVSDLALRVAATMLLTLWMINVVLGVIDELQSALVAQANTDPLTGAFNRRHFDQRVRGLAAASDEPRNALLAFDIDRFKAINDRHGHDVGDEVLCRTVALVHQRMRSGDLLFRTGGEEFVLLLPGADRDAALKVAEALRERIAGTELLRGETVTVSVGVSMQQPGQDPAAWIKRGDQALYEAKRSGRNRVVLAVA